ncbi:tetrapyrrole biosynthesis, uroporphyrinogen III synthase [Umbelopsis sp. PMI_123]|jgi:uroporphyrinogen-III synthase|nr:tetrapyrrole biosynthesis, uroporphyrinogen III synthase [Umbelopsis sp. PMI_123]
MTTPVPSIVFLKEKANNNQDPYETHFSEHKFKCVFVPVLEHCLTQLEELGNILSDETRGYSGLVVTSKRAVDALSQVWSSLEDTARKIWTELPIFTVGPSTAKLVRELGLQPVGETSGCAQRLGQEMIQHLQNSHHQKPVKLLFLVGDKRRDELPTMMRNASITMDELLVYETQLRNDLEDAIQDTITTIPQPNWVVVFSPSGSKALDILYHNLQKKQYPKPRIAAIGQTTNKHLKDRGYDVDAVAEKPDAYYLRQAVLQSMDKCF